MKRSKEIKYNHQFTLKVLHNLLRLSDEIIDIRNNELKSKQKRITRTITILRRRKQEYVKQNNKIINVAYFMPRSSASTHVNEVHSRTDSYKNIGLY